MDMLKLALKKNTLFLIGLTLLAACSGTKPPNKETQEEVSKPCSEGIGDRPGCAMPVHTKN